MKTIQGFLLIDVDVAALNNAGKDEQVRTENIVTVKKIMKNRKTFNYVSGQAWRYWWKTTLEKNLNWSLSPVTKIDSVNQAYTECNPLKYGDDDIFGYMRAAKTEKLNEKGEVIKKKNGSPEMIDITLTRISPLKNTALISVNSDPVARNQASTARHEGNPVLYKIEEYSSIMKGMFSIDIEQVGTFSTHNKTGYCNISEITKKEYLEAGAIEIEDNHIKNKDGNPISLVQINKEDRMKRIEDVIKALKTISGGAKQSTNMADVTPKLIVLANFKSGNHPFSHLAKEEHGIAKFSVEALEEVLTDYSDQFDGGIFVGKRKGFMDDLEEKLQKLAKDNKIKFGPINSIIDDFVQTIELGY